MRLYLIASAMGLALVVGGCRMSSAPAGNGNACAARQAATGLGFVNNFIEASFKANPAFAVSQGRHEYDGQIADLSAAGIRARSID